MDQRSEVCRKVYELRRIVISYPPRIETPASAEGHLAMLAGQIDQAIESAKAVDRAFDPGRKTRLEQILAAVRGER